MKRLVDLACNMYCILQNITLEVSQEVIVELSSRDRTSPSPFKDILSRLDTDSYWFRIFF